MEKSEKAGLPLKQDVFLEAGVHIGTKIRTHDMRSFVFKRRDDGLYILDLRKSAERLIAAAKLMAKYKPEEVAVVASRVYSSNPASKFAMLTGVSLVRGRFVPGTMTNLTCKGFIEPKLVLVCDPKGEREAVAECAKNGVPVIALCDTDNDTKFIDFVIPINNKGKRSLALIFYLLTREMMLASGKIASYDEFKFDINYFEQLIEPSVPAPVVPVSASSEAAAETSAVVAPAASAPVAPAEAKAEEKPAKEEKAEADEEEAQGEPAS